MTDKTTARLLPTDPFDLALDRLIGLPNGAHTQATVRQAVDFYGNVTSFMIQVVRHDDGDTAFVTQVNAGGSVRYMLPPEVLNTIARQRETVATMVRRRHGKRLAEERKLAGFVPPPFTPEARAKAIATRRRKTARKRGRRS